MGFWFDKSIEQEIEDFFVSKNLDIVVQSLYIGFICVVEFLEKEGDGFVLVNGNDVGSLGLVGSERFFLLGLLVN